MTERTQPSPEPLVSIITPSLNQGRFIRETIESVLSQDYANIEYLVMDGGSTDGTVEILRSYENRITWCRESDNGQSHAINKGFKRTKGDILAWLNSDDVLLEGAVRKVVETFREAPEACLVYGQGIIINETGRYVRPFQEIEPFNLWRLLYYLDYILQPAAFFKRSAISEAGWLDEDLRYAMDWDLWLKLAAFGGVRYLPQSLAGSREYAATKTNTGGWKRIVELGRLVRKFTGHFWTPGVRLYALDTLNRQTNKRPAWLKKQVTTFVRSLSHRIVHDIQTLPDGWVGRSGAFSVPSSWEKITLTIYIPGVPPNSDKFLIQFRHGRNTVGYFETHRPDQFKIDLKFPRDETLPFRTVKMLSNHAAHPKRYGNRCLSCQVRDIKLVRTFQ